MRTATTNVDLRDFMVLYLENIQELLSAYNQAKDKSVRLSVSKIALDDSLEIGKFPAIGVESNGHTEEAMSLGSIVRKYKLTLRANIWYYHEKISATTRVSVIPGVLGTISSIIRENPKIKGYCEDTQVLGSVVYPRPKAGEILSSGVVMIESQKVIRQNIVNIS